MASLQAALVKNFFLPPTLAAHLNDSRPLLDLSVVDGLTEPVFFNLSPRSGEMQCTYKASAMNFPFANRLSPGISMAQILAQKPWSHMAQDQYRLKHRLVVQKMTAVWPALPLRAGAVPIGCLQIQGLVNVLLEHHPNIRDIISSKYLIQ